MFDKCTDEHFLFYYRNALRTIRQTAQNFEALSSLNL